MPTFNQTDPIIEEIHAIRRLIAERFDFDVHRIAEDARRLQQESGKPVWVRELSIKAIHTSGSGSNSDDGELSNAAE